MKKKLKSLESISCCQTITVIGSFDDVQCGHLGAGSNNKQSHRSLEEIKG
jgi:hypothetical protein